MIDANFTHKTMTRIVSFEKRRSVAWLVKFLSIVIGFLIVISVVLDLFIEDILEKKSLDLLTLFQQDPEIIIDSWKDTLEIFFTEFPPDIFSILLISLMSLMFLIVILKPHLRLTLTRLKSLKLFPPTSRTER